MFFGSDGSSQTSFGNNSFWNGKGGSKSMSQMGNNAFRSDGVSISSMGNNMFGSNGKSVSKCGNTYFGSDGTSYTRMGNILMDNKGHSWSGVYSDADAQRIIKMNM